jgi:hypothetical protein
MKSETQSRTPTSKPAAKKSTASVSRIAPKKASKTPQSRTHPAPSDATERQRLIAEAAYFRAERRGFAPGYEETDWLEAEKELDMAVAGR